MLPEIGKVLEIYTKNIQTYKNMQICTVKNAQKHFFQSISQKHDFLGRPAQTNATLHLGLWLGLTFQLSFWTNVLEGSHEKELLT